LNVNCQAGGHAVYQLGFTCVFTALVLVELVLASLVDHFPKTEELERDEVSFEGREKAMLPNVCAVWCMQ